MSQRSSDPELNDIESALGGLVPVPSRLDRDAARCSRPGRCRLARRRGAGGFGPRSRRHSRSPWYPSRWSWPSGPVRACIERIVVVREPVPATLDVRRAPTWTVPHPAPADSLSDARSSDAPSLASFWPATSEYQRIQELVLRLGLDALPERPSPLVSRSDSTADPVDAPVPSAGHLRRLELEKLLNLEPGGPS